MSQKETAVTAYGEVEYETVECDSCENLVMKEEASRFIIGDYRGKKDWAHQSYTEYHIANAAVGWVCPYCKDEGPIVGTPTISTVRAFVRQNPEQAVVAAMFGAVMIWVCVMVIFG